MTHCRSQSCDYMTYRPTADHSHVTTWRTDPLPISHVTTWRTDPLPITVMWLHDVQTHCRSQSCDYMTYRPTADHSHVTTWRTDPLPISHVTTWRTDPLPITVMWLHDVQTHCRSQSCDYMTYRPTADHSHVTTWRTDPVPITVTWLHDVQTQCRSQSRDYTTYRPPADHSHVTTRRTDPLPITVTWLHDVQSVAMGNHRPWWNRKATDRVMKVSNWLCSRMVMLQFSFFRTSSDRVIIITPPSVESHSN